MSEHTPQRPHGALTRKTHAPFPGSFGIGSDPVVVVATLSQMLSLRPSDLVGKLKWLSVAIFTLFGAMHATAAFSAYRDLASARRRLASLCDPAFGFKEEGDAWTWDLRQEPMDGDVGRLAGTAVDIMTARI